MLTVWPLRSAFPQVQAYCVKHDDAPIKLTLEQETELREQPITGWDKDFIDVPLATLFHMILAANFLDIKPMLNLTCKVCGHIILNCGVLELRG